MPVIAPVTVAASAAKASILAVPLIYKSLNWLLLVPKSTVLSAPGSMALPSLFIWAISFHSAASSPTA